MEFVTDLEPRRSSLPSIRSLSSSHLEDSEVHGDATPRRLPPLPLGNPLPPGPFNAYSSGVFASTLPGPPDSLKPTLPGADSVMAPLSPASSAGSALLDSFSAQRQFGWPSDLSFTEVETLIAPRNITRKPPLQQLCGRKRKAGKIQDDQDDQREKHRIAEGQRRKNLSQLHRELDSRLHNSFLELAGWNPSKSLPQSKEHIVQAAIYLIDFMLVVILNMAKQDNKVSPELMDNLQAHMRALQLQQMVQGLQQQNQASQQQLRAVRHENETLTERNRALEFQIRTFEQMFRSPRSETAASPRPVLDPRDQKLLPGLRVFCDRVAAMGPEQDVHLIPPPLSSSSQSFTFQTTPFPRSPALTTGPSSPECSTSGSSSASSTRSNSP